MFKKLFFKQDVWSINISAYQEGERLNPTNLTPTITAKDVTDLDAIFVADPFLIEHENKWYVFYEVLPAKTRKGVISYSYSEDGENWTYGGVVLQEDYHLSYPYIFKENGKIYLIPEGGAGGNIKLYEAKSFPDKWEFVKVIKEGDYFDASFFYYNNLWWMMAMSASPVPNSLHIYYTDHLMNEWKPHALNPIIKNNPIISRPGGRVFQDDSRLIRFTQDGSLNYGRRLLAYQITNLTPTDYEEVELGEVISNSDQEGSWNKDGMHHIDIQKKDNRYLVAVDGYYYKSINKLYNRLYRLFKRYPM